MPKVLRDDHLLERVTAFVLHSGSCNAAATRLGVNRVTFWRFAKTGEALARTRMNIAQRLALVESETNSGSSIGAQQFDGLNLVPLNELKGIREMCMRMLAWVDKVEPQMLAAAKQRRSGEHGKAHRG
jgi:hypothetical protein